MKISERNIKTCILAPILIATVLLIHSTSIRTWKLPYSSVNPSLAKKREHLSLSFHEPGACWSRHEQLAYRKEPSHSHSPKFLRALREYEALHGRCTKDVRDWSLHLAAPTTTYDGTKYEGCKYLVYRRGIGGIGNRFLALGSAFLYALISGRALLIPTSEADIGMLCEPFEDSSWWAELGSLVTSAPASMENFLTDPGPRQSVFVNLDVFESKIWGGAFLCDDVQLALDEVRWLVLESDAWLAPSFHLSGALHARLLDLFPDNLAFPSIARYLFNPNNDVWDQIQRTYRAYFEKADLRIGVQIRTFSEDYHEEALQRIIRCAVEGLGLPSPMDKGTWMKLTKAESREDVAGHLREQSARHVAFLLTSLDIRYYKAFQEAYASSPMNDGSTISAHMLSFEGTEMHTPAQDRKAFVEIYLLSLCDKLMISYLSTFGYIAAALSGSQPWKLSILDRAPHKNFKESHPTCLLGTLEPCQQVIFEGHCVSDNRTLVSSTWPSHTRPCVDDAFGRELVVDSEALNEQVW